MTTAAATASIVSGCFADSDDDEPPEATPTPSPPADDPTPTPPPADPTPTPSPVSISMETVVEGLEHPWGMAFVPDDQRMLVTERPGRLKLLDRDDGTITEIDGVPPLDPRGQGGLLDLAFHPEFPDERWLYLTYTAGENSATTTHMGRGRLDLENGVLTGFEVLFAAEPFVDSTAHYGSRVVFGPDEHVYVTVGDRQFKDFGPDHFSQDTVTHIGTTVRLRPDGSVPDDNPFVDDPDALDEIYSYGHRNPQGMTVHPDTDEIWVSEHGERDGDELNVLEPGGNFGWPIAHYGCRYGTDEPVGDEPHEREDTVDPVYYWECQSGGFPPAGMTFYDADAIPQFRGNLFVGNLAGRYLGRFRVNGTEVEELDPLLEDDGWRIRDVDVAPDTGHMYVLVDADDAPVVRIGPSEN